MAIASLDFRLKLHRIMDTSRIQIWNATVMDTVVTNRFETIKDVVTILRIIKREGATTATISKVTNATAATCIETVRVMGARGITDHLADAAALHQLVAIVNSSSQIDVGLDRRPRNLNDLDQWVTPASDSRLHLRMVSAIKRGPQSARPTLRI